TTGELYVVIQKKQGMPSAKKKIEELFGNVEIIAKSKGYYILKSIKG
ncbi:methyltransferase, partial [Staphylococcus epidermidis]